MEDSIICSSCGETITIGVWPFCPHGKSESSVITDDIPGGVLIHHGICNEDGTPRRYYSKSEMAKEAKRRGLINRVEHVVDSKSGSDKNPHTQRWV